MKYLIVCLGLAITIISCGPSVAELEAMEMARQDSIRIADSVNAMAMAQKAAEEIDAAGGKTSANRDPDAYWTTYDTGLPQGTVHGFQPESEPDETGIFYVIVKASDGKLSVTQVDKKIWLVLQKGDIIK